MFDLIVLALRTDMTRVVTYMNGSEGNGLAIPEIGITQSRHQLSHHNGDPDVLERLAKSDAFIMQQFAYFLDKLKGELDGGEPLLDRTMVLFGSGMSYGHSHSNSNLPDPPRRRPRAGPQARAAHRLQLPQGQRLQARLRRMARPLRQAEGREGPAQQPDADHAAEDGSPRREVRRQPRPGLGDHWRDGVACFCTRAAHRLRDCCRADEAAPATRPRAYRTDGDDPHAASPLPWYQLQPGEFPPAGSEHRVTGELVEADFIHRRWPVPDRRHGRVGGLRPAAVRPGLLPQRRSRSAGRAARHPAAVLPLPGRTGRSSRRPLLSATTTRCSRAGGSSGTSTA